LFYVIVIVKGKKILTCETILHEKMKKYMR